MDTGLNVNTGEVAAVYIVRNTPLAIEFTGPAVPVVDMPNDVVGCNDGGLVMPLNVIDTAKVDIMAVAKHPVSVTVDEVGVSMQVSIEKLAASSIGLPTVTLGGNEIVRLPP